MSDSEYNSWMIETSPRVRPMGPIEVYEEAVAIFESYIGKRSKDPVKLLQFSCDAGLPKRFPVGTHASIEGAVQSGYGTIETLRELDLKGVEVDLEPARSPSMK